MREVPNEHIGKNVKCPKCSQPASIFDVVVLVQALFKNLSQAQTNLSTFQKGMQEQETLKLKLKEMAQSIVLFKQKEKTLENKIAELNITLENIQLKNAKLKQQENNVSSKDISFQNRHINELKKELATVKLENEKLKQQTNFATNKKLNKEQNGYAFANQTFAPELLNFDGVVNYLNVRKVRVEFKEKQMDISGFYDEIAVKLGDNYAILFPLLDKIRWAYRKNYNAINFDFTDNQKTDQFIMQFCKELYEYGFVVRQFKKRDKNQIHLELQTSTKIMNFFNGEWLEWYAFMKTASLLTSKKIAFSSLKNFIFNFENGEKHEADLFFVLPKNKPLWIECKSGEFRQDIQKYTKICKALNIPKENFLLLVLDESDEKMIGLSNTFDITFVSEKNFLNYIEKLL
ncbi:MAG: hypothetical protein RIT27_1178 [Pseudomonadota bacterium]